MLVEIVFGYPGIGSLLFQAISGSDYFVIYGVVFMTSWPSDWRRLFSTWCIRCSIRASPTSDGESSPHGRQDALAPHRTVAPRGRSRPAVRPGLLPPQSAAGRRPGSRAGAAAGRGRRTAASSTRNAEPASAIPDQPPSSDYPLGTDDQGRDLLAVMVAGLPLTLRVGFIAGAIGLTVGIMLGLLAGFRGGVVDAIIRIVVDTLLTVPACWC